MSSHWDWHAIGGALLTSLIIGADHDAAGHARVPPRGLRLTPASCAGTVAPWSCWRESSRLERAARRGGRCSPSTSSGARGARARRPRRGRRQRARATTATAGTCGSLTVVLLLVVLLAGWLQAHRHPLHRSRTSASTSATASSRAPITRPRTSACRTSRPTRASSSACSSVGLVDFDTAAGDDFDFKFAGINDPAGLARQIAELQREAMQGHSSPQAQHGV